MNTGILKKGQRYKILIHLFFIILCLCYVLPLVLIVSVSFSSEAAITSMNAKYSLIPQGFTLDAYKMVFENPAKIVRAYAVTAASAILSVTGQLIINGMVAYALSRSSFTWKGPITFIIFFTMLFSGGTIPTYIIYTKYYHLGNSFWIFVVPQLCGSAYNTLMMRTFFKGLSESLFESAKLDGASEFQIFWKIAAPLSKPVLATVGFMILVSEWNDWSTCLVYIRDENLYTLQYLLQRILRDAQFVKELAENESLVGTDILSSLESSQPVETLKYALCVVAAGPMLVVFPFFQKYFVKGTTIGAIKG